MAPDQPHAYPPEFHIETDSGSKLNAEEANQHLIELLNLRTSITECERKRLECEQSLEQLYQRVGTRLMETLQVTVAIVDQLRCLVANARGNCEPGESKDRRLLKSVFGGRQVEAGQQSDAWLKAFDRLVSSAVHELEDRHDVHHIPLLGQDLKQLEFQGQNVGRWVSVKNRTSQSQIVVTEEIRGLWVGSVDGRITPIQRGEVVA